MSRPEFVSGFADAINTYLDYKVASGFAESSYVFILRRFDCFCAERGIQDVTFTKADADAWTERKEGEASTTHYIRVNAVKCFLEYLILKGYGVFHMKDVLFKATDFQPHIYTNEEVERYFYAVDTYTSKNRMDAVQLPVLFRLLYCCGTRINETLGIKKKDVDLESGIIRLKEAKNNNERYLPLSKELKEIITQFANKCFYLFKDDDYIFQSSTGKRMDPKRLHNIHRLLLKRADIPYIGGGHGPRIHDWRHTFAVKSFKQMIDQGLDMYVALPVLSTYLGHKSIYATERYIRLTMELYPYIAEKYGEKFQSVFGKEVTPYETD